MIVCNVLAVATVRTVFANFLRSFPVPFGGAPSMDLHKFIEYHINTIASDISCCHSYLSNTRDEHKDVLWRRPVDPHPHLNTELERRSQSSSDGWQGTGIWKTNQIRLSLPIGGKKNSRVLWVATNWRRTRKHSWSPPYASFWWNIAATASPQALRCPRCRTIWLAFLPFMQTSSTGNDHHDDDEHNIQRLGCSVCVARCVSRTRANTQCTGPGLRLAATAVRLRGRLHRGPVVERGNNELDNRNWAHRRWRYSESQEAQKREDLNDCDDYDDDYDNNARPRVCYHCADSYASYLITYAQ